MESSCSELGTEETNFSSTAEENSFANRKTPIIPSTSIDSSQLETEDKTNSSNSRCEEMENDVSNSPTFSYPFSLHTCSKGNDNVAQNGQVSKSREKSEKDLSSNIIDELDCYASSANTCSDDDIQNLTESVDPNSDVCQSSQTVKNGKNFKNINESSTTTNEVECELALNAEKCSKSLPGESSLDSSDINSQPNLVLFSDVDSSSSESNKLPNLILKRWNDSPSSDFLWYNLKPCTVVLERYDSNQINECSKYLNCNVSADQLDTISVISDIEDENVDSSGTKRKKLSKLRSKKSCSSEQSIKARSNFSNNYLHGTIKGSSKMRKKNSKVLKNTSDLSKESDLDNDKPDSEKLHSAGKKNIQVSAQVHNPPEKDDSDAVIFNTAGITPSENCKNNQDMIQDSSMSKPSGRKKIRKRKRNPSSISSMSDSEFSSDPECVGSKRRIIKPSMCLQPSIQNNGEINLDTSNRSDMDASDDNPQIFNQSSEISEKLLAGNGNVEINSTQNDLSSWTYQLDVDISSVMFKPCHVELSRCDDQIEIYTSKDPDLNSRSTPIRHHSNLEFSASENQNRCNFNRIYSDLSDTDEILTDEVTHPEEKISPKQKKKKGLAKKLAGSKKSEKLPTHQKLVSKNSIMKEIIQLKNMMKRVEKKIDHLVELHQKILDSH